MKNVLALIFICTLSMPATAQFIGPGSNTNVTTVESVKEMKDDAEVILEGHIISQIKSEHYIFRDESGEVEIEIDDKDFRGIRVTPSEKIRITAEVDKDWSSMALEVKKLELVK